MFVMKKLFFLLLTVVLQLEVYGQIAGTFDSSFAINGIHIEAAELVGHNVYVKVQNNNKIVIAGSINHSGQIKAFIQRYNTDGSRDNSFGSSGSLLHAIGARDAIVKDLLLQEDGKICLAGHFSPAESGFVLRINSNGTLDSDFGYNGLSLIDLGDGKSEYLSQIEINTDKNGNWGYILAGHIKDSAPNALSRYFVIRMLSSGKEGDASFNNGSAATYLNTYNSDHYLVKLEVLENNNIMISGWFNLETNTTRYFDVFRLLPDGTIDTEFGTDVNYDGYSLFNFNNGYNTEFHDFKVLSSGKGLFCGEFNKQGVTNNIDIFALCMNSNGSFDNDFGTNSYKVFEFSTGLEDNGFSIAEIKNQKIIISGSERKGDAALVCLHENGEVNGFFGTNGELIFDVQGSADAILNSDINPDTTKLYVVGKAYNTTEKRDDIFIAGIHLVTDTVTPPDTTQNPPDTTSTSIKKNIQHSKSYCKVWPNPVKNSSKIHIQFTEHTTETLSVNIYELSGRKVTTCMITGSSWINLPANLPKGIYVLKVTGKKVLFAKKLIIQ